VLELNVFLDKSASTHIQEPVKQNQCRDCQGHNQGHHSECEATAAELSGNSVTKQMLNSVLQKQISKGLSLSVRSLPYFGIKKKEKKTKNTIPWCPTACLCNVLLANFFDCPSLKFSMYAQHFKSV